MSNIVRKLIIGKEMGNQMSYVVGNNQPLLIDNQRETFTVARIDEVEDHFLIYLKKDTEVQLWKKQPKNDSVAVEYKID